MNQPEQTQGQTPLENQLALAHQELAKAREALDASERRRRIDRELTNEGTIDPETAALLAEAALAQTPDADIRAIVQDLRRRKPFLFRLAPRGPSMAPRSSEPTQASLDAAAKHARATGDRRSLLIYLRAKRGT